MQSLLFFNKEGDNLNFNWNTTEERWEGDLLFHENSNDTFKTIGLYLFERIPSFEYEQPGILKLEKFQLFNEYKFTFNGSSYFNEQIDSIELVNTDPTFYSKWINGFEFEKKFPVGTQVYFEDSIFEFTNINRSYTVVQTRKNGILIISSVNNSDFNSLYGNQIGNTSSYDNKKISGLNSIGVYNYIDSQLNDNLSFWNEPDFYSKYFNDKKLNIINTEYNDGIYTVGNIDVFDKVYNSFQFDTDIYTQSQNFAVELTLKTDLPIVYKGALSLVNNRVSFNTPVPVQLKPGVGFTLPFSNVNTTTLFVSSIPTFLGNTNLTFYPVDSLVIWDKLIYQCIQSYTWSATSSITPDDSNYWQLSTYINVDNSLTTESFVDTEVHLVTNKFLYTTQFTQSTPTTIGSFVESYKETFKSFNVDLYVNDNIVYADLIYPSLYAEVKYQLFTQSTLNSFEGDLGSREIVYEQNVGIDEILTPERNLDTCENFSYNIVFTDLDEYGLIIRINGQVYQEQIDFIFNGINIDLDRTIDRTIRNWFNAHYQELITLGIIPRLQYIGGASSIYYNSINLSTEYPNVPLQFDVEVGTTADFYIEHSEVIFYDMSNYLEIVINGRSYGQTVNVTSGIADINTALSEWVDNYQDELIDYGIYVDNVNTKLVFTIKEQDQRLEYTINVGKSNLPGSNLYVIENNIEGSFGALITSNSVILPEGSTYSFEEEPFATGQIISINNTIYPYDNQEYNILYLGPNDLVLSYQGPFWGTTDPFCDVSPYTSVAFNTGFGATGCLPIITPTASFGGNFDLQEFTYSFSLTNLSLNEYSVTNYNITNNTNLIDILYLQISESIYVLGDKLSVINAETTALITTIILPGIGLGDSISLKFNTFNNYLYVLTNSYLYVVDPIINSVVNIINLTNQPNSIEVNESNGDVYVTYNNSNSVDIWSYNNFTSTPSETIITTDNTKKMVYNEDENDIYVTQEDDYLIRINDSRIIVASYSISGLYDEIFYEPINSSVYYFDSTGLKNINNGVTNTTSVGTSSFNSLIYNHISDTIFVSQQSQISQLDLSYNLQATSTSTEYGNLVINRFDEDVYLPSLNFPIVFVLDSDSGSIIHTQAINSVVTKLIFDPKRNTMIGIQPSTNTLIEISVSVVNIQTSESQTFSSNFDNRFGTLSPDYVERSDVWLMAREYIRKPRENYNDEPFVDYLWKWETDEYPEMFLYDFSGDQLPITGSYAYTGEKPLNTISLNKKPNRDLNKVSLSEYQQTIFDEVKYTLDHVDSEDNLSFVPEPLQTFIGFRSDNEGPLKSTLLLIKREEIDFTISPNNLNNDKVTFNFISDSSGEYGSIVLDNSSNSTFTTYSDGVSIGLKPGQIIKVFVNDFTNTKNKFVSNNNGKEFKIRNVYTRRIVVDFIDIISNETNVVENFPNLNDTTYLNVRIQVLDKEIGRFGVYGQTEIEDIRYKIELSNVGQNISADDIFIFKSYDINEQGVDWTFLNRKRKEMLMVRHDIFPYIGSYKSIINAINFFGYNDLELYEYYRNVNIDSPDFYKLFKVEIPDIFDNNVEGWTENDFIKQTMPNENFETTNLFNLTYKITDKEGNNVLQYSLNEVILKLEGLKYWLESRIVPITHDILDITGRADFVGNNSIVHRNYDVKIINISQEMTPVDFNLTEAYLMPVNSGSTVYTCHVDFSTADDNEPSYFTIVIRTYKTYKEWNPFTTYGLGDKVFYFDNIYESRLSKNKLRNPRKYDNSPLWDRVTNYQLGQIVNYNDTIYQYIGTQSSLVVETEVLPDGTTIQTTDDFNEFTPFEDISKNSSFAKWVDITEWEKIEIEPVQYIKEYRTGTHSFNFTIDSNIDPFITIEVTSDNGYGQIYTTKKNYEIRGLNDLFVPQDGDPIEPFSPIIQITNPIV